MTIEELQTRSQALQNSINETTNQVFVLQGHKQEVDFQITLLQKEQELRAKLEEDALVSQDVLPIE